MSGTFTVGEDLQGGAPLCYVTVTVDQTGLPAGPYAGNITVTDPGATNSPQTLAVNLVVYLNRCQGKLALGNALPSGKLCRLGMRNDGEQLWRSGVPDI